MIFLLILSAYSSTDVASYQKKIDMLESLIKKQQAQIVLVKEEIQKLESRKITGDMIEPKTLKNETIADNALDDKKIVKRNLINSDLADQTIQTAKIANNSLNYDNFNIDKSSSENILTNLFRDMDLKFVPCSTDENPRNFIIKLHDVYHNSMGYHTAHPGFAGADQRDHVSNKIIKINREAISGYRADHAGINSEGALTYGYDGSSYYLQQIPYDSNYLKFFFSSPCELVRINE